MEHIWIATKLGGLSGMVVFAAGNLDGGNISITAAIACCVFVAGIVWWLAAKFQKIDDKLDTMGTKLNNLPCSREECDNWRKNNE